MKYSYLQAMVSYIITVTIKISMTSCLYSCWMFNIRSLFFEKILCCHYYNTQSFLPIKVKKFFAKK